MKKSIILIFLIVLIAGCNYSAANVNGSVSYGISNENELDIDSRKPTEAIKPPLSIDLSDTCWLKYVHTEHSYRKWKISEQENELILERIGAKRSVLPPDGRSPSLHIGTEDMSDYNFSFDFLLNDSDFIIFSAYQNVLMADWDYYKDPDNMLEQWLWYKIDKNGISEELAISGDRALETEGGVIDLGNWKCSEWNHVELRLIDNNLHLIFNGEDKGTIYKFESKPHGTATICGGVGCKFKNISILTNNE